MYLYLLIGDECLEVGSEHVVVEGLFESLYHSDRFFVHIDFDFVAFHQLDCMEQSGFSTALPFECDSYSRLMRCDKLTVFENGLRPYAFARFRHTLSVHKFFKTGFFQVRKS